MRDWLKSKAANVLAVVAVWLALTAQVTPGQSPGAKRVSRAPERTPGLIDAAEEQFVRKLANETIQTLAAVATNPETSFAQGTLGAHVRAAYAQADPAARKALRPGSLKLVPMTGAARPSAVVRVGAPEVAALRAQPPGLSSAARAELRTLIDRRMNGMRASLGPLARSLAASTGRGLIRMPKTSVEGGIFGEGDAGGKQDIVLNQPETLGFRWRTEEVGAALGYWELRQRATGLVAERVLATGTAVDDKSKAGIQGFFEIDLAKHLPPRPPASGELRYFVRVKPIPVPRREAQKVDPGARGRIGKVPEGPTLKHTGPPREPAGVGPWSGPVVIHYGASTAPPQKFDEVYRRADFHLDSIRLVRDQKGSGDEQYHLAGFIQSHSPSGAGNQYRFGPFSVTLDPDGPRQHAFGRMATYQLPSAGDFPRVYTVVLSIVEEDNGELIQSWIEAVWKIARGALADEIEDAIRERLSDIRERMANDVSAEAMQAAMEALKEATTNDFYSAWVKLAVTIIAGAIEGGLPDDYYGTEVITFVMPTNRVDSVRNQFAFAAYHKSSSPQEVTPSTPQLLTGELQGGLFRVKGKTIRFYGQAAYPEAGSFDGIVNATMHWVLSGRGL